jgi:hypothetical protein
VQVYVLREISRCHDDECYICCLLGYRVIQSRSNNQTFRRYLLPPLTGQFPRDYTAQYPRRRPSSTAHLHKRINAASCALLTDTAYNTMAQTFLIDLLLFQSSRTTNFIHKGNNLRRHPHRFKKKYSLSAPTDEGYVPLPQRVMKEGFSDSHTLSQ